MGSLVELIPLENGSVEPFLVGQAARGPSFHFNHRQVELPKGKAALLAPGLPTAQRRAFLWPRSPKKQVMGVDHRRGQATQKKGRLAICCVSIQGSFFLENLQKPGENSWCSKRTMVKENGEPTPRMLGPQQSVWCSPSFPLKTIPKSTLK